MRVDTHVHIFPEEAGADPQSFAALHDEPHWLNLVAPPDRPSIQSWADPDTCLRHMDSTGIDVAVLQGWYWESANTCELHNEIYTDIIKKWPDRFRAFASFHPDLVANDPDFLDKIAGSGFVGLGELLPQAQGYAYDDPLFIETLKRAENKGLWVNFHATEPAGGNYPGRVDTSLQQFVELAKDFSNLKIILSHLGGGLALFARNPGVRKYIKNVFFDTAAWPLIYSEETVSSAIKLAGLGKFFYGTDYPLRTFPRHPLEDQMSKNLNAFLALPLNNQEDLQRIMASGLQIRP